jgi:U3 small nucleolar RNA-associated protein 14
VLFLLLTQKFTAEEAAERAARLSKMRHLLFYAEQKAKRLSKIKSKEYHRCAGGHIP